MKKVIFYALTGLIFISCQTLDIEKDQQRKMNEENVRLKNEIEAMKMDYDLIKKELEFKILEEENIYDIEPVIIPTTSYVVIDRSEMYVPEVGNDAKPTGRQAVKQSMKESVIPLKEYVGGTSIFDYNENSQFPVFTKLLSMTTIILNNDEMMVDTLPFMSDSNSWEITGDVWSSDEGDRQLIMIKPKSSGLETNMLIVTNKRLYHFVLYSTQNDYQPMVKFRYPTEPKFITSRTKKVKPLGVESKLTETTSELLSFNYRVSMPAFQKKVDWFPEVVYDDGSHTYIRLPEIVLQKEMPGVWEGNTEITNYEIHPTEHNLIIINKLIEKLTLKVGNKKVTIDKKRGEPIRLTVNRGGV